VLSTCSTRCTRPRRNPDLASTSRGS
jgi:hypothetical protein